MPQILDYYVVYKKWPEIFFVSTANTQGEKNKTSYFPFGSSPPADMKNQTKLFINTAIKHGDFFIYPVYPAQLIEPYYFALMAVN